MNSNLALSSLNSTNTTGTSPGSYKRSKVDDEAEHTKSYIGDGTVVEERPKFKKIGSEKMKGGVKIYLGYKCFNGPLFIKAFPNLNMEIRCQVPTPGTGISRCQMLCAR